MFIKKYLIIGGPQKIRSLLIICLILTIPMLGDNKLSMV
jgi:hypothetical protein